MSLPIFLFRAIAIISFIIVTDIAVEIEVRLGTLLPRPSARPRGPAAAAATAATTTAPAPATTARTAAAAVTAAVVEAHVDPHLNVPLADSDGVRGHRLRHRPVEHVLLDAVMARAQLVVDDLAEVELLLGVGLDLLVRLAHRCLERGAVEVHDSFVLKLLLDVRNQIDAAAARRRRGYRVLAGAQHTGAAGLNHALRLRGEHARVVQQQRRRLRQRGEDRVRLVFELLRPLEEVVAVEGAVLELEAEEPAAANCEHK